MSSGIISSFLAWVRRASNFLIPTLTRARRIIKVIEPQEIAEKTGDTCPHTVHCGPGGIYVAALGNREDKAPGGVFVMDQESFEPLGRREVDRGPQQLGTTPGGASASTRW